MDAEKKPGEIQEATYTFTFTVTRKGPGIDSRENWLEFKRTVQTHRLTLALAGAVALVAMWVLIGLLRPKPLDLSMPESHARIEPIATSTGDVITPLNARDPASLVLPPGR